MCAPRRAAHRAGARRRHHRGRALLFEILPKGLSFDLINQDMTKKAISATINACYRALV